MLYTLSSLLVMTTNVSFLSFGSLPSFCTVSNGEKLSAHGGSLKKIGSDSGVRGGGMSKTSGDEVAGGRGPCRNLLKIKRKNIAFTY